MTPNKHILYLTSSKLSKMMVTERWLLSRAFKRRGHTVIDLESDPVYNYDLPHLIRAQKKPVDLILFEEPIWATKLNFRIHFSRANQVAIPKATLISDYWTHTASISRAIKHNHISVLITNHEGSYNYIGRHFSKNVQQILWIPLTIDLAQFDFPPPKKRFDFFLSGTTTYITPFRNRLIDLLNKQTQYRVFHVDHPGHWKNLEEKGIRGTAYYQLFAQSHFCLVTSGIFNISSRKYWEICAAGSTIFGNWTGLPEHFMIRDNIVALDETMSDSHILKLIKQAYNNKKEWRKRAKIAQQYVRSYCSNDFAVQLIEDFAGKYTTPPGPNIFNSLKDRINKLVHHTYGS